MPYTFRDLDEHLDRVPSDVIRNLSPIEAGRGRQDLYKRQNPAVLKTLTEVARIQSTEASNAIEGITAPHKRIEELVAEKTTPRDRSEAEIAGYRSVLDTIHSSAPNIPFTENVIKQFHGNLYQFTSVRAGIYKVGPNQVEETHPDGRVLIVFQPASVGETPPMMEELFVRFQNAWNAQQYHPLFLLGSWVFDFLMIHPFQDGNGRMARLVTLLLLYHAGYEVGRYVSLEKLIDDSRQTYYDSLKASTGGWHDGEHDIWPWLNYLTGIIVAAYKEFEDRVGATSDRGGKRDLVLTFMRNTVQSSVAFDDVRENAPGVSDVYIGKILRELRDAGAVRPTGRGRGARWEILHRNF